MARQKKKWNARPFESIGETFVDLTGNLRKDSIAQLYESQLQSPAFMSLTARQKILWVYVKSQLYGKAKPRQADYEGLQIDDNCFYFNHALAVRYGLYAKSSRREFYNDMKVLCDRGFIEVVSSGKNTRTKSVYRFSCQWKYWKDNENENES